MPPPKTNGQRYILILEDNPQDVYLTRIYLAEVARIVWVDNLEDYKLLLQSVHFDLILADVAVPGFKDFDALDIAKLFTPTTPFIYMSGSIYDETLAKAMKRGAHDVIQKDRVARLEFIVKRLFGLPL